MNRNDVLDFLREQKPLLEKEYHIDILGLFGSFARNEQNQESDIDIVYSTPKGSGLSFFQIVKLENELQHHFNRKVELVNFKYLNPLIKYKAEKEIVYV